MKMEKSELLNFEIKSAQTLFMNSWT